MFVIFKFKDLFYNETDETEMKNSLSRCVANILKSELEKLIFSNYIY